MDFLSNIHKLLGLLIILQVQAEPRFKTTIFSTDFKTITFHPVLTEMGVCYTFSGIITDYLIPK